MKDHTVTAEPRTEVPRTDYKDTLNLPKTDFPIRPQAAIDDPAMIARWEKEGLYRKAMELHNGSETYILHDGPPYANGNIHLGHAYNKILKDIITKAQRMSGKHVPVTPGWDCHGLPIELKVVQENQNLSSLEIKKACRAYAQQWIDVQRTEFKRLGVVMDWEHPYITMSHEYEAEIMRALGILVDDGFIERKHKTVAWCASCQTTLATAEIEYEDRKDPSIYVLFTMIPGAVEKLFGNSVTEPVYCLVWTTTPWTLPLNRAVAVKPKSSYSLIRLGGKLVIVATALVATVAKITQQEVEVLQEITSDQLRGLQLQPPIERERLVPIIFDDFVSLEEGTACVHVAPGCGPADYELGVKNNLEIYSPISADGKYTAEVVPAELAGMPVSDGQIWVIKKLAAQQLMLYKTSIRHSYPHCWRCHQGLIFRATRQWFFDLQREGIKEKALQAVEQIQFIPDRARNFLRATLANRWEWCLSRQRNWGVPIPALVCNSCEYSYTNGTFIAEIAKHVAERGIEYWDEVPLHELMPKTFACPSCKSIDLRKERDILDVWFDSGVSHYVVLYDKQYPDTLYPADLYLEGIDQFRGWFQSSLITSLVLEKKPAMRAIMSHGFTVDEKGRKMSKSLGNVVAPAQLIDRLGTDGLRLWVASIGGDSDAVASEKLLTNVAEVYRKVRNTCRFLLQNLYDFDVAKDALPLEQWHYVDRIAIAQVCKFAQSMQKAYRDGDLTIVFHGLADYCSTELSALYLDVVKDRLYVESAAGRDRRSAQTALWNILDTLNRLMAPILSFTAEQISDHYQRNKQQSVHLQCFADTDALARELQAVVGEWESFLKFRSALLKTIELQREQGIIKHPLEAHVTFFIDPATPIAQSLAAIRASLAQSKETFTDFVKEMLVVSQVQEVADGQGLSETPLAGVYASVQHATGEKCPRCWHWHEHAHANKLCTRCSEIVAL